MKVDQTLFNVVFTIAGLLGGWVLNTIWQSVKDLQKDDKVLSDRVADLEVTVVGKYITREEFNRSMDTINTKLDKLVDRLETKVDKQGV